MSDPATVTVKREVVERAVEALSVAENAIHSEYCTIARCTVACVTVSAALTELRAALREGR